MSTATQRFIEDAVKGGWSVYSDMPTHSVKVSENNYEPIALGSIFLDPLAWQAVMATRDTDKEFGRPDDDYLNAQAKLKFGLFATELFSGKTIEEALQAIE